MPKARQGLARGLGGPQDRGRKVGRRWAPLLPIAAMALGCGGDDTGTGATTTGTQGKTATLTISLSRGQAQEILATVHAADASGNPVKGAVVQASADFGTAGEVSDKGGGDYAFSVAPAITDGEVRIEAEVDGVHATKTAIVLSTVSADWDQAEAIDGLVNTPGWEDGASVSPDGEWLLLGTYVPIDIFSCAFGGGGADPLSPDSPACNAVVGPYSEPERPDMLGADRIVSTTEIQHSCPDLHFPAGGGNAPFAVPPVAAYGFHRQADGSYAEPFVIGYSANGCLGPYGLSFVGAPAGGAAEVLFANDDPLTQGAGDTANDLYWAPITLGQKNILAKYSWDGSKVVTSDVLTVRLPLADLAGTQGNVNFAGGRLWWDDESVAEADRQLYVADVTGALPQATISAAKIVGASRAGLGDIQPALDGDRLYWMGSGQILTATLTAGADPGDAASWSVETPVIGPDSGPSSTILATGEPTIAHDGADTWLYFVYIKRTDAGYDANIGRIRRRP